MAAGDIIYAADSYKPIVRLTQQTAQTGNASAATVTLTFGTSSEVIDTDNFHSESTNNSRVTPTKAGYYRVVVKGVVAFSTTITGINVAILKNGAVVNRSGNHKPNTTNINAGAWLESWHTANGSTDYFEAAVSCTTSSGTWDTNAVSASQSELLVEYMRPL